MASQTQVYIGRDAHRAAKIASAYDGMTLREWIDAVILSVVRDKKEPVRR